MSSRTMRMLRGWRLVLPAAILAASALLFASCAASAPASHITIEMAADQSLAAGAAFDEMNATVVRSASVTVSGNSLDTTTSKSKSFATSNLVFIQPATGDYAIVAVVPLAGGELDYDMSQARFYAVKRASAEAAANDYGMAYSDWQVGAANGSDKFPCCE